MTEKNLAIVFAPNILRSTDETPNSILRDLKSQHKIVTVLIKEFDTNPQAEEDYERIRSNEAIDSKGNQTKYPNMRPLTPISHTNRAKGNSSPRHADENLEMWKKSVPKVGKQSNLIS
mmetsp:Transcript_12512/g.20066  ORF Transcript_12512/g.20066 Transcript_12512/m.20066 type:complete len:118 (+) Transcript_12512:1664-2017(+)